MRWMSFFTSELPMVVEFVVSPLRGWARVAPPLALEVESPFQGSFFWISNPNMVNIHQLLPLLRQVYLKQFEIFLILQSLWILLKQ